MTQLTGNQVYESLHNVLMELVISASEASAYKNWSDEFARKDVRRVWENVTDGLRKKRDIALTLADLQRLSDDHLYDLGFQHWDETTVLIPLWCWNYIQDGITLTDISGDSVQKTQDLDLDCRGGCTAYGFRKLDEFSKWVIDGEAHGSEA